MTLAADLAALRGNRLEAPHPAGSMLKSWTTTRRHYRTTPMNSAFPPRNLPASSMCR